MVWHLFVRVNSSQRNSFAVRERVEKNHLYRCGEVAHNDCMKPCRESICA